MKRDEIAEIIWKRHGFYYDIQSARGATDAILSTLTKDFEVVEDVGNSNEYPQHVANCPCPYCHGSGTITRQATIEEVLEGLTILLKGGENYLLRDSEEWENFVKISNGGRLRVKK